MTIDLNDLYTKLATGARCEFAGDTAPSGPAPDCSVPADLVRAALLAEPWGDVSPPAFRTSRPLHLKGAWVTGSLDLSDVSGDAGQAARGLLLERCTFERELDFCHARVERLSLAGSRFTKLSARGLHCTGPLDISDVASSQNLANATGCVRREAPLPLCWLELSGAQIGGDVRASGAKLACPPNEPDREFADTSVPYALLLDQAHIGGSVRMNSGFTAHGGVNLRLANIDGTVYGYGARVTSEYSDALHFEQVLIRGSLALASHFPRSGEPEVFRLDGCISLYSATIEGEMFIAGVKLKEVPFANRQRGRAGAIMAYQAKVGKFIRLQGLSDDIILNDSLPEDARASIDFECFGAITFQSCKLRSLEIAGARIGNGDLALVLDESVVEGDLKIGSTEMLIDDKQLGGPDNQDSTQRRRLTRRTALHGQLLSQNVEVGGSVEIKGVEHHAGRSNGWWLGGSKIGRSLTISRDDPTQTLPQPPALTLPEVFIGNVECGQDILLAGVRGQRIWLARTTVSGSCTLSDVQISGSVDMEGMRVGQNLGYFSCVFNGMLDLRGTRVSGNVVTNGLVLNAKPMAMTADGLVAGGNVRLNGVIEGDLSAVPLNVEGRLGFEKFTVRGLPGVMPSIGLSTSIIKGGMTLREMTVARTLSTEGFKDYRQRDLGFYPGWRLVEGLYEADGVSGAAAFVWNGKADGGARVVALPGISPPIHRINASNALSLNASTAIDYLRFFCAYVWGEEGAFNLVENPDVVRKYRDSDDEFGKPIDPGSDDIRPLLSPAPVADDERRGAFRTDALVAYSNALFTAKFRILPNGLCEMLEDRPIGFIRNRNDLPRYAPPLRLTPPLRGASGDIDPDRPWPIAAPAFGAVRDCTEDEALRAVSDLKATLDRMGRDTLAAARVRRVRLIETPFYPGWCVAQGLVDKAGEQSVVSWLWRKPFVNGGQPKFSDVRAIILDGTSPPIHEFNIHFSPDFADDFAVEAYVRFFGLFVWGTHEGTQAPFLVVESEDELNVEPAAREKFSAHLRESRVERHPDYSDLHAVVSYAGMLFGTTFRVWTVAHGNHSVGMVEMLDDDPIVTTAARMIVRYDDAAMKTVPPTPAPPDEAAEWPVAPGIPGEWKAMGEKERKNFRTAYVGKRTRDCLAEIDLRAVRTSLLDDDYMHERQGKVPPDRRLKFNLSGFQFEQILSDTTQQPLDLQADKGDETKRQFEKNSTEPAASPITCNDAKRWLDQQFVGDRFGDDDAYDAEPYERTAQIFTREGKLRDAIGIRAVQLQIEAERRQHHWDKRWSWSWALGGAGVGAALASLWGVEVGTALALAIVAIFALRNAPRIAHATMKWGFLHGLSWKRATAVFLACVMAGWFGVLVANQGRIATPATEIFGVRLASIQIVDFSTLAPVLVLDADFVHTMVAPSGNDRHRFEPVPVAVDPANSRSGAVNTRAVADIPCGEAIDPLIYALDVFLPLVDLRQESRCAPTHEAWARGWVWGKAFYSLLGWIVTSMTILTVTGVMRRRIGG